MRSTLPFPSFLEAVAALTVITAVVSGPGTHNLVLNLHRMKVGEDEPRFPLVPRQRRGKPVQLKIEVWAAAQVDDRRPLPKPGKLSVDHFHITFA